MLISEMNYDDPELDLAGLDHGWMVGWMDEWMVGWMNGWMDGWIIQSDAPTSKELQVKHAADL